MGGVVRLITGVLLSLLAVAAYASPLVIDDSANLDRQPIAQQIQIYTGDTLPENAKIAAELPDDVFQLIGSASPLRIMQTQWFRFSVRNEGNEPRSLVVDFDQALFSRIEWRSAVGGQVREFITGQSYPRASADVKYNYVAFRLDIPPGETVVTNFSIYTPYAPLFVPSVSDSEVFLKGLPRGWQISGAVFGMLYAVVFCLLIYLVRMPHTGIALALLGQVSFSLLSILYFSGVIQSWLPDAGVPWRDIAYVLIHSGQGIFYCLAVMVFFRTKLYYPILNKIIFSLIALALLILVLLPIAKLDYLATGTQIINFFQLIFATALAVTSIARRQQDVAFFSVGLILFALMAVIYFLYTAGIVPPSIFTRHLYELGLTIQADIMFAAIALRMFAVERDKLIMKEEILRMEAEMKVRSEFVDRVTHDIKSPLTAVLGAEQLLRNSQDESKRDTYLNVIRASCGMVISIVDNILSHARITSGKVELNAEPFSLRQVLLEMEASANASASVRSVALHLTITEDIPETLYGDKIRVSQLISNLVTNAFKFTDDGRVTVSADLLEKSDDTAVVRIVVQDTGIGMSEAFLEHAFEPYSREENRSGYRSGFGLGLSICKEIVELMGGTIDVLSAVDRGSRFTVVLPFKLHK